MNFDIYKPFTDKNGIYKPGIKPVSMSWGNIRDFLCTDKQLHEDIMNARKCRGDKTAYATIKKRLPAVCFTGTCQPTKTRAQRNMKPTGLMMIDIDHCESPVDAWKNIQTEMMLWGWEKNCLLVHKTVSGEGLRLVLKAPQDFTTLEAAMEWANNTFKFDSYGMFDAPCKDFSRLSFLPLAEEILFESPEIEADITLETKLENLSYSEESAEKPANTPKAKAVGIPEFTDEEKAKLDAYEYKGTPLKTIIEMYVEEKGEPGDSERHNYYNQLVVNFRNCCNNSARILFYLLPRFGHEAQECWDSCTGLTKSNKTTKHSLEFWRFLVDHGFLEKDATSKQLREYMMSDEEEVAQENLPWLPPVFREFIRITPKDFRTSMVNALLPVMGTLASYLQGEYYYDGRMHTTSFFSIIYAPAGTGKGFVERIINVLFEQLKIRDYVQQARENIWLTAVNTKSQNDKTPPDPHTSLRIIAAKNSESEFLSKQKENHGYHMFTYAAEMDSWAKGVRAAGGNKDDMIRVAWDNGTYGQNFKGTNTFKGEVALYWNVLITGTIEQLYAYFKNVTNGLITRCSFTTIENQQYAEPPVWKSLNKRDMETIRRFMERCDANTYEEPCDVVPEDIDCVDPSNFDKEVPWHFHFKRRKTVDMEWLRASIADFNRRHMEIAARDMDDARDVFRRRVAVRGFRLGLLCYSLWENPRQSDLVKCIPFIEWWMEQDIEHSLKLWGARYNQDVQVGPQLTQRPVYSLLKEEFTKEDVYSALRQCGRNSRVDVTVSRWIKMGFAKKIAKNRWKKESPKDEKNDK